jgi:hypothetical protein
MEYYVYLYFDDNTPIYVGKGKGNRMKVHLSKFIRTEKGKIPFYDKLHKMRETNKIPKILIVQSNLSEEDALSLEKKIYDFFGNIFDGTGSLFNYNVCGVKNPILIGKDNPMYGKSLFDIWVNKYGESVAQQKKEEYKKKMSESLKGKKHSETTKEKIKLKKTDYWENLTFDEKEKFKNKISKSHTEERKESSRQRIIEQNIKMRGGNHPKSRKCIIEGIVYETIKEVCNVFNFKNHNTVRHRIISENYPDWQFLN